MSKNIMSSSFSDGVSVLFNEPKLLKSRATRPFRRARSRFSALQRAEIAEIPVAVSLAERWSRFSALQRAEIAEIGVVRPQ